MGQRTIVEVLAAIATTERVSSFLAAYDERDQAIEELSNEVIHQRMSLAEELRTRLVEQPREAIHA